MAAPRIPVSGVNAATVARSSFTDAATVADRVALAPIGEGELVQASGLSDPGAAQAVAEVSLALERDRAIDGRLRSGDLVDVFATYDDRTEAVVERVRVVEVSDTGGASFTSASQVTVTLALTDAARRAPVVHAARAGEVTLVRSTHLPASAGPAPGAATAPGTGAPSGPPEPGGTGGAGASDGSGTDADGPAASGGAPADSGPATDDAAGEVSGAAGGDR
jgi:hypothetical protein